MHLRIPTAAYRLQFNSRFVFPMAADLADYLEALGITDCYASPLMRSTPGSLHNYDVTDHTQINPELGTEEEFGQFAEKLKAREMGLILDLIPNHMCISVPHNPWWNDVLENGPASFFENFFNIDWGPIRGELKNKVLLPFLDQQFGKVIENKELQIRYDNRAFYVHYFDSKYPTNPKSWNLILEAVVRELENGAQDHAPDFYELLSIITALEHLPSMTETGTEKVRERMREKEIIKSRLAALLQRNAEIQDALESVLNRFNGTSGSPHTFDHLENFLMEQAYRLSHWRVAHDEINYRRFFDISELAGIRAENPRLFAILHDMPLRMVQKGWVTGLRIDHVDGLFNPCMYLKELQRACFHSLQSGNRVENSSEAAKNFYIVVEKILSGSEKLRNYWPIFGTTGYDFLNTLNSVFVDPASADKFQEVYRTFTGHDYDSSMLLYESKKFILNISMSSELHVLAKQLDGISEQHRYSRDFTLQSLFIALRTTMACLSVYRTYISAEEKRIDEEDKVEIQKAVEKAKQHNPALSASIFNFIENVLLLNEPSGLTEAQKEERNKFVMRFQQLTGPVTAKGLEDTAFYRYYPLASLNDVGADLEQFSVSVDTFHKENLYRQQHWPHTLLTTSTHDTKRSEDVRARINVLSEIPEDWANAVHRWEQMNRDKKLTMGNEITAPDRNEEYLLYQTLIGSWPMVAMDDKTHREYVQRIDRYMNKAMKEAKIHTSWINPNEEHDLAVRDFIHAILNKNVPNPFLDDLEQFIFRVKYAGIYNSLSQLLLKIASPGVPDFYQGSELWCLSLVDPDNRSTVDYEIRRQYLEQIRIGLANNRSQTIRDCFEAPENGKIKMLLTQEGLKLRKKYKELFSYGDYTPLSVSGDRAAHVIAFSRTLNGLSALALCGRFFTHLTSPGNAPLGHAVWQDTEIEGVPPGKYRDLLTHRMFQSDGKLILADVFSDLPFALLTYES